jgi:hypothetical protein
MQSLLLAEPSGYNEWSAHHLAGRGAGFVFFVVPQSCGVYFTAMVFPARGLCETRRSAKAGFRHARFRARELEGYQLFLLSLPAIVVLDIFFPSGGVDFVSE